MMVDIDPKLETRRPGSFHISMSMVTLIGAIYGAIAVFSGYVGGIMTAVKNEASTDARMARIESKFDAFVEKFDEWKLRQGTKQ